MIMSCHDYFLDHSTVVFKYSHFVLLLPRNYLASLLSEHGLFVQVHAQRVPATYNCREHAPAGFNCRKHVPASYNCREHVPASYSSSSYYYYYYYYY